MAHLVEGEKKGTVETNSLVNYLVEKAQKSSKTYFIAVLIGYLLAILTTVVIMIIFNHGQPALLYLVPGCLLSVLVCSLIKGEYSTMWNFSENHFLTTEEDKKKD
jgi:minor histocompatibility antigen H13